jgi:LPXTG-motif cell wall-anchored protein
MGSRRQRIAGLVAALALGLAAPAWGQGAGDEQYQDPFGESQQEEAPEAPAAPEPEPQEPAPAPTAPPPAAEPAQAPPAEAGGGGDQLPYTGADAGLLALGGTLLLAGGIALRVRLSAPAPRRR